jgi:drug/metabolite transporter (DMT)-like permease
MTSRVIAFVDTNLGMLLIIVAQFFFVCMNLGVKQLDNLDMPMHTLELIAVRMAITLACCVLYMMAMKIPDPFLGPKGVRLLLVNRGLCGFFGLFGMYYSLQYLSLADATVLSFLSPLAAAIGGYIVLKEPYSRHEAFAAIVSLLGVILIARPPFLFGNTSSVNSDSSDTASRATSIDRIRAVCIAVFGIILGTGALLSMRAIGKRAHPMHLMMFFSAWCTIVASAAMYFMKIPIIYPHKWQWAAMLIFIGLSGFFAQTLTTIGYQRETAARGSMGQYVQLLFAGVLEYVFFGTVPSTLSLIGATIIMISAIYVIVSKKDSPKAPEAISLREPDSVLEEGLLYAESLSTTIRLPETSSSRRTGHEEELKEKPPSESA